MAQQVDHVVVSTLPQTGTSRHGFTTRNGQKLSIPITMQNQRSVMLMQNRPLIMHQRQMTIDSQKYSKKGKSTPMPSQRQRFPKELTAQQHVQLSLPMPSSVANESVTSMNQNETSILPQTHVLAPVKTLADTQPQPKTPSIRKSVKIDNVTGINSPPEDPNNPDPTSKADIPFPSRLPTKLSDQNKCSAVNSNPAECLVLNQTSQYNNNGGVVIQTDQTPGNSTAYFGDTSAIGDAICSSRDVPSGEPSPDSNHHCDQSLPHVSRTLPAHDDPQRYLLPKALQELLDEKVENNLGGVETTLKAPLDCSLGVAEHAGDSEDQRSNDPTNCIKVLKTKQEVMECVMQKLLRSMKQIDELDADRKNVVDVEANHRIQMTRMMQLLMLQKKNLQQQVDVLSLREKRFLQTHHCLRKHSMGCAAENLELNKKYQKLQADHESKDAQIKTLMQLSCKLQKQIEDHANVASILENAALEVRRLVYDNENLKTANQKMEASYVEKNKELEAANLQVNQLELELDRIRVELTNQRTRKDECCLENSNLRNQLGIAETRGKTASKKSAEYGQLNEAYENLQFDHQRLQMLYTSETETRRELHNELQEVNGNIRVISRFRPAEQCGNEETSPFEFCALDKLFVCEKSAYQRQTGHRQLPSYAARDEVFAFNRIFQENANQTDVFEEIRPIVRSFVDGYNVCILAYGPTGSGKTYTMQGTKDCPGICPRAVTEVFELCYLLEGIWCTEINIAMFEIHNEVIYDLLASQILPVKLCDNGSDVRLINAEEKITTSEQDTMYWIERGYVRRKVSCTRLNSESSRSHLIIRMHLNLVSTIDNQRRTSSLVLCDLAGSESAERIEADEMLHVETGYINRSLVTLARVFETLRRKSGQCASTGLAIPYRDSKLTHLLKPCLGGQAKCVLIVTTSPEERHLDRTLKALEFAQRAMQVSLGRPAKNNRILVSNQTP